MEDAEQLNSFLVDVFGRINKIEERAMAGGLGSAVSITEIHSGRGNERNRQHRFCQVLLLDVTPLSLGIDGTFAIGMASRELKDDEAAQLTGTAIALDGIAVVVNPANTIDDLSMDQIKGIYVGDITDWGDLA